MSRNSLASTDSDIYVDPTLYQRLDRYLWPFDATDKLANTVFTHKVVMAVFRVVVLAGLVLVLILVVRERSTRLFAYPEVWSLFTSLALYSLLCLNYLTPRFWKFAHFFYELSWCLELSFTFIYWSFLSPLGNHWSAPSEATLHGGVFAVLLADYLNNTIYFYRRHLRVILLLAVLYILINIPVSLAVYSAYRELSYVDGWSALGLTMELLCLVLAFLAGAQLDRFKYRYMQKPIDSPLMDFEDSVYVTAQSETNKGAQN